MGITDGWRGRFFEDFEVDDVYRHPLGRTITATDNAWFTLLTLNTNPMHLDDHYAEKSPFGRQLVNSTLTLGLVTGMSVSDVSQNAMANLGWDNVRLLAPVYVGDTLYAETLVTGKRPSQSRPYAGIVSVRTQGIKQTGERCIVFDRNIYVHRRDSPQLPLAFPEPVEPLTPNA